MVGCRLITDKVNGEIQHYMKLQSFFPLILFCAGENCEVGSTGG